MALPNILRLRMWFSVGVRRRPTGPLSWFVTALGVVIALYVISAATMVIVEPWTLSALFLGGMMTIGFLTVGAHEASDPARPSLPDWVLSVLSAVSGLYFTWNARAIEHRISLFDPLSTWDLIFAAVVFVLVIELTRRSTGLGLTTVALVFVAYNLFGHHLGGVLKHGYIGFEHFMDIMMFTTDGVYGLPVRVAATYAFLFVLFGTMLQATGGGDFFFDFSSALSGRQPGGPAKIAVISSGLYGMVSGSPTSDVVTTGSITIPIMRRLGYHPILAGAVEVAASTGGSVLPPVMGSAAFLMAEYTGIDYRDIAIAAVLPALLYYLCIYSQVHFRSLKMGLKPMEPERIPRLLSTLKEGGLFVVPLVALTWALLEGYTPTMVAVFGTLTVLVVATLRKRSRIGPVGIVRVLSDTTQRMVPVAGAVAAAGLIIGGITMTGLAAKFAHVIYAITDAQVFPSLVLAAALTVVLGLGMPTPSAYILAAVLMGPLLNQLHVPLLAGHLFLLYFAVMSAITPPVAVAAYAASSIAEANPLAIAAVSVRLALAAFIVPFAFIYAPGLLWIGSWFEIAVDILTAIVGVLLLALAVEGYWRAALHWLPRVVLVVASLLLLSHRLDAAIVAIVSIGALWLLAPGFRRAQPLGPRPAGGDGA